MSITFKPLNCVNYCTNNYYLRIWLNDEYDNLTRFGKCILNSFGYNNKQEYKTSIEELNKNIKVNLDEVNLDKCIICNNVNVKDENVEDENVEDENVKDEKINIVQNNINKELNEEEYIFINLTRSCNNKKDKIEIINLDEELDEDYIFVN